MKDAELRTSAAELAAMLKVSTRRINQIAGELGLKRTADGYPLAPIVGTHVARLAEKCDTANARREQLREAARRHRVETGMLAGKLIDADKARDEAGETWGKFWEAMQAGVAAAYHGMTGTPADDARNICDYFYGHWQVKLIEARGKIPAMFRDTLAEKAALETWLAKAKLDDKAAH